MKVLFVDVKDNSGGIPFEQLGLHGPVLARFGRKWAMRVAEVATSGRGFAIRISI